MKKIFTMFAAGLVLLSVTAISAGARSVESLYSKYADAPGAESVSIGRFWINLARCVASMDEEEAGDSGTDMALRLLSNLTAVRVADLDNCSEDVLERFRKDAQDADIEGYEMMTKVRDGEDRISIFVRKDGDVIRELIVLSYGEDPAIIQIEGEITEEEAGEFAAAAMS